MTTTDEQLAAELKAAARGIHAAKATFASKAYEAVKAGWNREEIAKGAGVGTAWLRRELKEADEAGQA
jgi:hypothetical protein